MKSKPSISVIVPTCDRPRSFVLDAIESVIAQTLKPSEILLIDNGTQPVERDFLPNGIHVFHVQPKVGVSRARNFGAAMAKGQYLAFLDDDDLWDTAFLEECLKVLQSSKTNCVYGRIDKIKNNEHLVYLIPKKDLLTEEKLLQQNYFTGGINLLISKELFWRVGGFDPFLKVSEDRALALEVLRLGEAIEVAPKAAAIVRFHDGARLRHDHKARLAFIWKYRKSIGAYSKLSKIVGIFNKIVKTRLKSYFRTGDKQ